MKALYILLLLSLHAVAQPMNKTDWQKEMLKGKVKYIKSTRYILPQAEKDLASIKPTNYDIDSFNTDGYRVKTYHVDSGKITWATAYTYNAKYFPTEKIQIGKEITHIAYTYDTSLQRIEQVNYKADGSIGSRVYSRYDQYGNIMEQRNIGVINNKCVLENDSTGRPLQMFCYGNDESLQNKYVFTYDMKGRKLSAGKYDPNGKQIDKTLYKYDENNNEIELRVLDKNEQPNEIILTHYQYDSLGNWVTMVKTDEAGTVKTTAKRELVYY